MSPESKIQAPAGIGLMFKKMPADGSFVITTAAAGSPAAAALSDGRLNEGDELVAVDGMLMQGRSFEDVVCKIKGELKGIDESFVVL